MFVELRKKYLILSSLPIYFILVGFVLQPLPDIFSGFFAILENQTF